MVQTRPLTIKDFSGGFTDDYVNAPLNMGEKFENILIEDNKSFKTRFGSHVEDATNAAQIPGGSQRIGNLINYDQGNKLFYQSVDEIYYRATSSSGYTTLVGPVDSNDIFPNGAATDHVSFSEWKKHLFLTCDNLTDKPKKIYKDSGGAYRLRNAGLPDLASSPTITPTVAGSAVRTYAFHYHYTYTVGSQEFQDFGPVTTVQISNGNADPSANQEDVAAIPAISNGANDSWDTATIKVYIYRTIDGGTTFYKIGEVTNGTAVFTDNFADSAIQTNLLLYTDGGVLENDPPPLCKYVHVVNNYGYYAHLKEGSEVLPYDILQSVNEDPDSVPATNRITVEDEIKGFGSVQSIPLVFCRKYIYRIEGAYDEFGNGAPTAIRINDTAGCISHRSIVAAKDFVFWAGNDKFYASDGYKVVPISDHITSRYANMLTASSDKENIIATYDEVNERVLWSVQEDSSSSEVDTIWALDLRWGLTKTSTFTSLVGGTSFRPTALVYLNGELYRGDSRGYVFVHSETDENDPKVDTSLSPSSWTVQPVRWEYKGFATDFGIEDVRKWVSRFYLTAKNEGDASIGLFSINDDGNVIRTLAAIRERSQFVWGDPLFIWGDEAFEWNGSRLIQESRRMPRNGLRCQYLQMQFNNAFAAVTSSDDIGLVTVDATNKVATLSDADANWPSFSVDYFLAFADDGYVKEYLVTERTDTALTFVDSLGLAPSGSTAWVLRGYPKSEVINILSYTIPYAPISHSANMFESGDSGEVST